jgi:hypothetical protein
MSRSPQDDHSDPPPLPPSPLDYNDNIPPANYQMTAASASSSFRRSATIPNIGDFKRLPPTGAPSTCVDDTSDMYIMTEKFEEIVALGNSEESDETYMDEIDILIDELKNNKRKREYNNSQLEYIKKISSMQSPFVPPKYVRVDRISEGHLKLGIIHFNYKFEMLLVPEREWPNA